MVDKATNEFWRDLSPIANPFKPHALPEAFIAGAASDAGALRAPRATPADRGAGVGTGSRSGASSGGHSSAGSARGMWPGGRAAGGCALSGVGGKKAPGERSRAKKKPAQGAG